MPKIRLADVKTALLDPRFRQTLPEEARPDLDKFLANPGCACNHPIYRMVLTKYPELISAYYPGMEYEAPAKEEQRLLENHWRVINCSTAQLEGELRRLPPGRKQLAVTRFEDQVTVVVNELEAEFTP